VVQGQVRLLEGLVDRVANRVLAFERHTARDTLGDLNPHLDEMFRLRLDLGIIRNTAFNSRQVYHRILEALPGLSSGERAMVTELRDRYDRILSACDNEKELLLDVLDFFQTRLTNDLNQLVKRFTSIGAILVFCTLVTGVYGMNFEHMPELSWKYGYPLAIGTMAALAGAAVLVFRRKGWL
jgi:magnesium transporter